MKSTLSFAAQAMNGTLHGDDREFAGVSTDSRTIREDQLFIALSGPNFDGNKFVNHACGKGAAAAVVTTLTRDAIPQIEVADTRIALGQLAAAWRGQNRPDPNGSK